MLTRKKKEHVTSTLPYNYSTNETIVASVGVGFVVKRRVGEQTALTRKERRCRINKTAHNDQGRSQSCHGKDCTAAPPLGLILKATAVVVAEETVHYESGSYGNDRVQAAQ